MMNIEAKVSRNMSCEQYHQHPHHLIHYQAQYKNQHERQQHSYSPQPYHQYKLCFIISVALFLTDICNSLTMTEVDIPNHIMRFKSAVLGCRYTMDGESLYSVKWYKDGYEFYRYLPRDKPPAQAFPLPGVSVDLPNSSAAKVTLRRVTLMSTGVYKCEVSGEAPAFNTVSDAEMMSVVLTPNHGPRITGGYLRYNIGELVRLNCTSAPSKPACHLNWLINGEPASRSYLRPYDTITFGREALEVSRLGLEFRVKSNHFIAGDLKLKCVAKISSLYWQSNEASVVSDLQNRAPALESRETVFAKSRTHGSSSAKPFTFTTLKLLY
ncbi:PREDICTED: uncharacterized protein LOC108360977 [Rhagoletis zephyria]|uniref:uncharacterized protein LOC108360977 n=1 Tax=Rhagoletis zephyria TaxID=28612 RepID=UPI0008116FD1|nr:PREDICTED: uncharacterized protein LOC108360977 [Rhagoletis zephyria]